MDVLNLFYLFSFLPLTVFSLIFWGGIKDKKQFGKRPQQLLISILIMIAIGLFALVFYLLPTFWGGEGTAIQLTLFTFLYVIAYFFLENSIHIQRLVRSFFIDKFNARLKPFIISLVALGLTCLATAALFVVLKLGSISKENYFSIQQILIIVYAIGMLAFLLSFNRSLFSFSTEVIRRNQFLNITLICVFICLMGIMLMNGLNQAFPLWLHLISNISYLGRLTGEYFIQRTKNLDRLISKQEAALQNKNELITNVVNSPLEEDASFIRQTVTNEIERARSLLAVPEHSISGVIIYTRDGDLLKVGSAEQIIGVCIPIMRLDTLKLYKNIDQLNGVILRTPFDLHKINTTPRDQLASWGEQILKDLLQSGKEQIIENLPPEARGHQSFIALYPVFEKENLLGLIVCFKNAFNRLFPEEENALNNLVESLKVIFAIIRGKHIQQERNRLQGELEIAKRIQTSILPKTINIPGYECAWNMVTATEVGGDVYDYCPSEFGSYLGIGDASGHGLPAGITALIQLTAFQAIIKAATSFNRALEPFEVYDLVNKVLCEINRNRIGSDKFMTQNYFLLKDSLIRYAGAHLIALVYKKASQSVELLPELANRTAFLGLSEHISSKSSEGEFSLSPGDILLLYTDGIIEAKNNGSEQFGLEKLKEVLLSAANEPAGEIIKQIMEAVTEHARLGDIKKHKGHLADDASLFVLRRL